ncbi:transposase [Mesorhizobium sp. M1405]|uniref:IS66 family transposase n=1 Tax=unclassified Mesorhizobium TaxID=325217 RepID=UPI003339080D
MDQDPRLVDKAGLRATASGDARLPRIFCDETRMPVRREDKKTVHIGQFWAHATDDRPWNGPAPPAVVYVYAEGCAHKEIRGQLAAFQGLVD